ncbi:MAG TPA: non-lysosomal glucosylceramidase [Candidatus Limnocylindria bacterium]|nr:non-lysosomal glucosylceramidase [Candidatus Limnocylindria bacterium]
MTNDLVDRSGPATGGSNDLFDIPRAAWTHPLGEGFPGVGGLIERGGASIDDGPWAGVPVGGLGSGSIGRTQRGDFARWHLRVGQHRFEPMPACGFAVFIDGSEAGPQAHVLSTLRPSAGPTGWSWDLPEGAGTYRALFPRAWTVVDWPRLGVDLAGAQLSPILPGNMRESSYPIGLFEWRVRNPTARPLTVALMFSWQALTEDGRPASPAEFRPWSDEESAGVVLRNAGSADADAGGEFAIAVARTSDASTSICRQFAVDDGSAMWADFAMDGVLRDPDQPLPEGAASGAAIAIRMELAPGATGSARFALAWDFPIMRFGSGTAWYRRYTRFFGRTGRAAQEMARQGLRHHRAWESAIERWQAPLLTNDERPEWFSMALLNELYVLVDGGTAWEDGLVGGPQPADGEGNFALLECFDYPYYNTYDVMFYASWAVLLLWPKLEHRLVRSLAEYVALSDPRQVKLVNDLEPVTRKLPGAVPHDAGGPSEDPWLQPNAYDYRNSNRWKDLNPKFVLQLWRDRVVLDDPQLARAAWPAVKQALDYIAAFDLDGDGLPEHDGTPDQTFDNWPMTGASAYGGGLWLAALSAAVEMAREVGDADSAGTLGSLLARGRQAYVDRLWNGRYFEFDAEGMSHDSVMADQLCGVWYCDATGLPPYVDDAKVALAMDEILARNVRGFAGGTMGAINGAFATGGVDDSNLHAREVWPGVTYGLAALFAHRGRPADALEIARGAVRFTYERGLWFRTPEAWDAQGDFRATIYMRPLAIWAIEYALGGTDWARVRAEPAAEPD